MNESENKFNNDKDNILCSLPFGYEYILVGEFKFISDTEFKCTVNIKNIHDEYDVKEWIARLSESTLTTWRVLRTYPASGRCNVYKIAMKCQHNVNHKYKQTKDRKRNYLSKHTGCPSNMTITIKRYIKNSKSKQLKSKNPSLIEWPCYVNLNFTHNHPLNTAAVLKFRPLGNEIREKIITLFNKGHTPTSALESIKLELFLNNDDKYFDMAEDGFYIPTQSQIKYIYSQIFSSPDKEPKYNIQDLISNYNSANSIGKAEVGYLGGKLFVAICSPIMSRAHMLLPHSSQVGIVETSGGTEKKCHKIYFVVTQTPAGSIPLGCVITDDDNIDLLNAALSALKQCFPPEGSFFRQSHPSVLMTSDEPNEQELFKNHWPKSVLLFCQHRLIKTAWKWINCTQNVPKTMREEVYYIFKCLIYCQNEKDLHELYAVIIAKYQLNLVKFLSYVNIMWPSRTLWSSAYRYNIPIGCDSLSNFIEVTFKVTKECILQRIRHYNLTLLADFILTHHECYVRQRLIDFTKGKVRKKLLYKYIPPTCIINPSMIIRSETDFDCYIVPSESDYSIKYIVDVKHCLCSCEQGTNGKICKHLCGVINQIDCPFTIKVPQPFNDMFYKIATGSDPVDDSIPNELPPTPVEDCASDQTDSSLRDKNPAGLSTKEQDELHNFYNSINIGLQNNCELFVPAIRSLLKNVKSLNSEKDFISALSNFGGNLQHSKNSGKINKSRLKTGKNASQNLKKIKMNLKNHESHFVPILPKIENAYIVYDPLSN